MPSRSPGEILFLHRSSLLLVPIGPIAYWALSAAGTEAREACVGIGLVLTGVLLRLWATRHIGRGARVHRAHASGGLIVSGPFAWTRNPLYWAAGLMLTGLSVLAGGSAWAAGILPLTFLVYTPVVAHEERALLELFGPEYRAYLRRVPRWAWRTRPLASRQEQQELFPLRQLLYRERRLLPGMTAALVGVWMVREQLLPLRSLLEWIGFPTWLVLVVVLGLGIAGNGVVAERKRARSERRRLAKQAGSCDASSPAPPNAPGAPGASHQPGPAPARRAGRRDWVRGRSRASSCTTSPGETQRSLPPGSLGAAGLSGQD